jgi:putative endonuclease
MRDWYLYLLECLDGSYYTGIAVDVDARFAAHLSGRGARYTRAHKPRRILAHVLIGTQGDATRAEAAVKRLPKGEKIEAVRQLGREATRSAPA